MFAGLTERFNGFKSDVDVFVGTIPSRAQAAKANVAAFVETIPARAQAAYNSKYVDAILSAPLAAKIAANYYVPIARERIILTYVTAEQKYDSNQRVRNAASAVVNTGAAAVQAVKDANEKHGVTTKMSAVMTRTQTLLEPKLAPAKAFYEEKKAAVIKAIPDSINAAAEKGMKSLRNAIDAFNERKRVAEERYLEQSTDI